MYLSESYFWGYLKLSKIKYSEGRINLFISICQLADRQQNNEPTAANNCAYTDLMHYSWKKLHKVTDYGNLSNLVTEKFGFNKIDCQEILGNKIDQVTQSLVTRVWVTRSIIQALVDMIDYVTLKFE